MHPILSIFSLYNSKYNRPLRILDYYIRILFPFFFCLLQLYLEDNGDYLTLKNKRDIKLSANNPNDLSINYLKVIIS